MKKCINNYNIAGILYEHNLELRTAGENSKNPGSLYIRGSIGVATDDNLTNIVTVYYTYVSPKTTKGTDNSTYKVLADIINGIHKTYMDAGDAAAKVRIDSAIGVNDFYTDRNGSLELVSAKRAEGGFIHVVQSLEGLTRNKFDCDLVITNVTRKEADEENNVPEKAIIKGCVFNFRKALIPVEFSATSPEAMDYFEDLEASAKNPVFTRVWGSQLSEVTIKEVVTESAFGPDSVRTVKNTRKDWLITGAAKEVYDFGDEKILTAEELKKAISERELYLAGLKKTREEASTSGSTSAIPTAKEDDFKF